MLGIIIITHGNLSEELVRTSRLIVGEQEKLSALAIKGNPGPEAMSKMIHDAAVSFGRVDGVVVLTDMLGGTPCNVSSKMALKDPVYEVVTGVNLPMLLSALNYRGNSSLSDLADKVVKDGINSIGCPCRKLRAAPPKTG